jgi:C1A family cysteine protease
MTIERIYKMNNWMKGILLGIFFAIFIFSSSAFSNQETDEINAAIKQKGAKWVAGETSLSKLSDSERRKRLGLIPSKVPIEIYAIPELMSVPATFDWRNYNGNFVTPIRDQGNCGSCWAFATTAALESQQLIINNTPGINLDLSEQILVCCSSSGDCNGGYIDSSSNYIQDTGLPSESCCAYTATNSSCNLNTCTSECNDLHTITGWHWVTKSVGTLKSELCTYGPLIAGMRVYKDFISYQSGIYSKVKGSFQGYHAVLIVGYNDAGQYFIVKNSWGTGWGEAGYFRIAYSELTSVVAFASNNIAYEN